MTHITSFYRRVHLCVNKALIENQTQLRIVQLKKGLAYLIRMFISPIFINKLPILVFMIIVFSFQSCYSIIFFHKKKNWSFEVIIENIMFIYIFHFLLFFFLKKRKDETRELKFK